MDKIRYFFRGTPDGYVFPVGSVEHWLIIAIILLGIELITRHRYKLRDPKYTKEFKIAMIIMLSLQQIVLYLWYGFSGYFSIQESLPLYNCRVAIILTIFAFITNKDFFKNICCYWGIVGAILALAFPVVDPFQFPHYTMVSFFGGHILMLWSAIYFLVVEKHYINKRSLVSILLFTNIYHVLIYVFDKITNSNYCYLVNPPFSIGFIDRLSQFFYTATAINVFNVTIFLFYYVCKVIYNHYSEKGKIESLI
jgi:hypothetical integral membrane protein (TIGR02206 family)